LIADIFDANALPAAAYFYYMILGSKGHEKYACIFLYDIMTRKTRTSSHFSKKNERIVSVLEL
jgi:hypothetical protein